MPPFIRNRSARWHDEIPGARWFTTDLHIHTLDDHPSSKLKRPANIQGDVNLPETQAAYARQFLKQAIQNDIEVLGLTPHSVRAGDTDETSATWKIIDVWNNDDDDDGVPFRDKIYDIFPGFEPSFSDGSAGIHLIILFDPEICREQYLSAFQTIMGGVQPWDGNNLRISPSRCEDAFGHLYDLKRRSEADWDYICLAPHSCGQKGLLELKSQILRWFKHQDICGLELGDNQLPEDATASRPWLKDGMSDYNQAFFHASDAYSVEDIGKRYSFLKLASPYIESLRQSFLASDSRSRMAYSKDKNGNLIERTDLPSSFPGDRPWLRSVTIRGGTSFFAYPDPDSSGESQETFRLNPDLNCIIGGRMSGKSTFLDGLRYHFDFALPSDEKLRKEVTDRAQERFLSGDPEVEVDIRGPVNPEAEVKDRWPAVFFTQRELQIAVSNPETRMRLLYQLIPSETQRLLTRSQQIEELDIDLNDLVGDVDLKDEERIEANEELEFIKKSLVALDRFKEAGIAGLSRVQNDDSRLKNLIGVFEDQLESLHSISMDEDDWEHLTSSFETISDPGLREILDDNLLDRPFLRLVKRYQAAFRYAERLGNVILHVLEEGKKQSSENVSTVQKEIQEKLIELGGDSEELNQFAELTEAVADAKNVEARHRKLNREFDVIFKRFMGLYEERRSLIEEQRQTMEVVSLRVSETFPGEIRVRIAQEGDKTQLDEWITGLRDGPITRWWNNNSDLPHVTPTLLDEAFYEEDLSKVEMTGAVEERFYRLMDLKHQLELKSLRNEDKYIIELNVGKTEEDYREIERLSGGARVSVLLSLLLQCEDSSPLVIDQPEEESDKLFLFQFLLPALHRLKGKRQIIFATHDANIVVNGDADNVLYLEADANTSSIAQQGAIEHGPVREVIINILDGGRDAFELRKSKYGF